MCLKRNYELSIKFYPSLFTVDDVSFPKLTKTKKKRFLNWKDQKCSLHSFLLVTCFLCFLSCQCQRRCGSEWWFESDTNSKRRLAGWFFEKKQWIRRRAKLDEDVQVPKFNLQSTSNTACCISRKTAIKFAIKIAQYGLTGLHICST